MVMLRRDLDYMEHPSYKSLWMIDWFMIETITYWNKCSKRNLWFEILLELVSAPLVQTINQPSVRHRDSPGMCYNGILCHPSGLPTLFQSHTPSVSSCGLCSYLVSVNSIPFLNFLFPRKCDAWNAFIQYYRAGVCAIFLINNSAFLILYNIFCLVKLNPGHMLTCF